MAEELIEFVKQPGVFAANWDECRVDLDWSQAKHNSDHRKALELYLAGNEPLAFMKLCDIQDHNPRAKRNYALCRATNMGDFWQIAFEVYKVP